jgi:hypothetical protein
MRNLKITWKKIFLIKYFLKIKTWFIYSFSINEQNLSKLL